MSPHTNESQLASAFTTLICAWVLALVVLGLSGARPATELERASLGTATASR